MIRNAIFGFVLWISDAIRNSDFFNKALERINTTVAKVTSAITNFVNLAKEKFAIFREFVSNAFNNVDTSRITDFFAKAKTDIKPVESISAFASKVLEKLIAFFEKALPVLSRVGNVIWEFFKKVGESISDTIANIDFSNLFKIIKGGLIGTLVLSLTEFIHSGSGFIDDASSMFEGITEILDGVKGSLQAWQNSLNAKTLLTIAAAIGVLTVSLLVLSSIDNNKLAVTLASITLLFADLMGSMAIFSKTAGTMGGAGAVASLVAMSVALLILSGAVKVLASIDPERISQGLGVILDLTLGLVVLSKVMSKNSGSILKGSAGLIAFSLSLYLLVGLIQLSKFLYSDRHDYKSTGHSYKTEPIFNSNLSEISKSQEYSNLC